MKNEKTTRTDNRWDIYSNLAKGLKSKKTPLAPAALGSAFLLGLPMAGMAQEYCYQMVNTTLFGTSNNFPNVSTYAFDFDQDGNNEAIMSVRVQGFGDLGIGLNFPSANLEVYRATNLVMTLDDRPNRFDAGQTVTEGNAFFTNAVSRAFLTRNGSFYWADPNTTAQTLLSGYAVFIFQAFNGDRHMGWMQLEVNDGIPLPSSVRIIDWAYNTIPIGQAGGNSITTGTNSPTGACVILPVELTHFEAKAQKESIALTWRTETEEDNAGFELQRSENGKDFKTLTFIEGAGSTVEPQEYAFEDKTARPGVEYFYRLKQIDFDAAFEYSEIVTASLKSDHLEVSEVFPNPVREQAQINVTLPKDEQLTISIFDLTGKPLRVSNQQLDAGVNTLIIHTSDLPAGSYFVKLENATEKIYRKIIIK